MSAPMDQRITPNFWLSELMMQQYAVRFGIRNVPSVPVLENIRKILAPGLERVRGVLNARLLVSKGYVSQELNELVGGAPDSLHMEGLSADFTAPSFGSPIKVCRKLVEHADEIGASQIFAEGRWVHVGFQKAGETATLEVLTVHFVGGHATYSKGLS